MLYLNNSVLIPQSRFFFPSLFPRETHLPHLLLQPSPIPIGMSVFPPPLLAVSQLWSKAACMSAPKCVCVSGTSVDKTNGEANTTLSCASVNYFSVLQMLSQTEYTTWDFAEGTALFWRAGPLNNTTTKGEGWGNTDIAATAWWQLFRRPRANYNRGWQVPKTICAQTACELLRVVVCLWLQIKIAEPSLVKQSSLLLSARLCFSSWWVCC